MIILLMAIILFLLFFIVHQMKTIRIQKEMLCIASASLDVLRQMAGLESSGDDGNKNKNQAQE